MKPVPLLFQASGLLPPLPVYPVKCPGKSPCLPGAHGHKGGKSFSIHHSEGTRVVGEGADNQAVKQNGFKAECKNQPYHEISGSAQVIPCPPDGFLQLCLLPLPQKPSKGRDIPLDSLLGRGILLPKDIPGRQLLLLRGGKGLFPIFIQYIPYAFRHLLPVHAQTVGPEPHGPRLSLHQPVGIMLGPVHQGQLLFCQ